MSEPRIERPPRLSDLERTAVADLVERVAVSDGRRPLSDQAMLDLRAAGGEHGEHVLLSTDGTIAGYAHIESGPRPTAELVAPDPGALRALLEAVRSEPGGEVQVWAHGTRSGVGTALIDAGWRRDRELLQLRRSLRIPLEQPGWPPGVTVRTFIVGQDEDAWLAVNNRAFAGHPEQSGWTRAHIEMREREAWFDPHGFFLAERGGELVGFHWTKVHDRRGGTGEDRDSPIGEVYVVGVDPSMQGHRLGAALTIAGLRHLRDRGLPDVMLYVDATNTAAVRLYEHLGFAGFDTDVCYLPPR